MAQQSLPPSLHTINPLAVLERLIVGLLAGVSLIYAWVRGSGVEVGLAVFAILTVWACRTALIPLLEKRSVRVDDAGLTFARRGQAFTVSWADITGIKGRHWGLRWRGFPQNDDSAIWYGGYTLTRADGTRVHLSPLLRRLPELAYHANVRIAEANFPHARAAFDTGQSFTFGHIKLTPEGVHIGYSLRSPLRLQHIFIAWGEFVSIGYSKEGDKIVLYGKQYRPRLGIRRSGLPNDGLCYKLMSYAIAGR